MKIKQAFLSLGIGTVIYVLISAAVTPIITRLVSTDVYGRWSLFVLYGTLASNILMIGLDQAFVRFYYDSDNLTYRKKLLFFCIKIPLVLSTVLLAIIAAVFLIIKKDVSLIIVFFIYLVSLIAYRFGLSLLRLNYKTKLYSFVQCSDKVCFLIVSIILLKTVSEGEILLYASVVATVICVVLCTLIERKTVFNRGTAEDISCSSFSKTDVVKYAFPLMFSVVISSFFQATDKTLLGILVGDSEVGIYAGAMSIVNIFAVVQTTFSTLWMPMAIEHHEKNGDISFYVKANRLITVIMVLFGMSIVLFKDLLIFFLGEDYRSASNVIPFLIHLPIMYTISETTVLGIVLKKKSVYQILSSLGGLVVNFALDLILVPAYGAVGAAFATAVSYFVFLLMRTALSNRVMKIPYSYGHVIVLILMMFAYSCCALLFDNVFVDIAAYFALAFVIVLLNGRFLLSFVKKRKDTL